MKVILLQDVPKIGRKYEVKNVSDGHAINFLMPKGLAELATEKGLKKIEVMKQAHDADVKVQTDLLVKNLDAINSAVVTLKEKANEKGHLFAGIHKAELVPALKEQTRLDISPDFIVLDKPLKEIGEHTVSVEVGDKKAAFKVVIEALQD
jgi:large subunit ribosomal protein L9